MRTEAPSLSDIQRKNTPTSTDQQRVHDLRSMLGLIKPVVLLGEYMAAKLIHLVVARSFDAVKLLAVVDHELLSTSSAKFETLGNTSSANASYSFTSIFPD